MNNPQGVEFVFFKSILDNVSDAILFESFDRKILYVNQYFCDLFKIPVAPNHLLNLDCSNAAQDAMYFFSDPDAFLARINEIYLRGENVLNEEVVFKDGIVLFRDFKKLQNEPVSGYMWIYKNISILKRSLDIMTHQKEFYENLLNNIPADIAIFNEKHQYQFVNKIGVKSDDLSKWIIGKDDFEYVKYRNRPVGFAQKRREVFEQAKLTGKSVEMEEVSTNDKNITSYILRKFYPIYENGSFVSMIGYGMDITSIRESEKEAILKDALFSTLIENTNELVITVDQDFKIHFANLKWINNTGYSYQFTTESKITDFISTGSQRFLKNISLFYLHEKYAAGKREVSIFTINKQKITLKYDLTKYTQKGWTSPRIMIFFTDITEQVKSEFEFKKNLTREKYLNELKTNFMNMVSHELRTPLSVILSNTELLVQKLKRLNVDTVEKHTNMIVDQIDGMINLLNEFLFVSKIEAGKIQIQFENNSLTELIENIIKAHYNPWLDGRFVDFVVINEPINVVFDKKMFQHIIINLLNNAFKYSINKGNPKVELKFSKNAYSLTFIDHGIGISEIDQQKLFQPFARGENVGSIEGTGLGLVIVKYFLKHHNGKFHITSKIGEGTTISLHFPYLKLRHL